MTPPICITTRYGPGCGHETSAHDGNPLRPCDCCARAKAIEATAGGLNRRQRRVLKRLTGRRR